MTTKKIDELVQDFLYRQMLITMDAGRMLYDDYLKALGKARSETIKQNGLQRWERIELNYILAKHMQHSYRCYLYAVNPMCALCLQPFSNISEATIDHIVPRSIGGSNEHCNKQLAHGHCNTLKGNRNIRTFHEEVFNRI